MPDRHRTRPGAIIGAAVALVLLLLTGPTAAAASAPFGAAPGGAVAPGPLPTDISDLGVTKEQLLADLADDHVAALGKGVDPTRLIQVVADARSKGMNLSVITTTQSLSETEADAIAKEVQPLVGGTLLMLSQQGYGIQSSELSDNEIQQARKAASSTQDDVLATQRVAEVGIPAPFPWLRVLIIAVVLIGGVALIWFLRRRRTQRQDETALAELTKNLNDRLSKLAPLVIGLPAKVDVAGRPDLTDRFNTASADYAQLKEQLGEVTSRAQLDDATARIADLEKRLGALDGELDALLPGLEPPTG